MPPRPRADRLTRRYACPLHRGTEASSRSAARPPPVATSGPPGFPQGRIGLTKWARRRAKQIASYPWFLKKKAWQREIGKMIENGFKLEVEALISRNISYVTEEYTPERLEARDWLD